MSNDKPYLGRCGECDYALFATAEQIRPAPDWKAVTAATGPYRVGNYGIYARCPNRHKVFGLKQIKGTYSEHHKCDSRCLNARGHECRCSCGGMNHGRGYAVEAVNASEIVREVPPVEDKATDKQLGFLRSLLAERDIPANNAQTGDERREHALAILGTMTKRQASNSIEWLLQLPRL